MKNDIILQQQERDQHNSYGNNSNSNQRSTPVYLAKEGSDLATAAQIDPPGLLAVSIHRQKCDKRRHLGIWTRTLQTKTCSQLQSVMYLDAFRLQLSQTNANILSLLSSHPNHGSRGQCHGTVGVVRYFLSSSLPHSHPPERRPRRRLFAQSSQ